MALQKKQNSISKTATPLLAYIVVRQIKVPVAKCVPVVKYIKL